MDSAKSGCVNQDEQCVTKKTDEDNLIIPIAETKQNDEIMMEKITQIQDSIVKMQQNISGIRSDVDKLKTQMIDKLPKAVLSEVESKINHHSKAIETSSKKLFELQTNLSSFMQQPMSHTLIDTMRTQLTEEIIDTVKKMILAEVTSLKEMVDEKNIETRGIINNAKKVMFIR